MWSRSDGPRTKAQRGVEVLEVLVVVGEDAPVVVHQRRDLTPHGDENGVFVLPQLGQEVAGRLVTSVRFVRLK